MWTRVSSVVLVTAVMLVGPALGTSEATHGGGGNPDAVLYELLGDPPVRVEVDVD